MCLLKSWRVKFFVTNKSCQIRKVARVDDVANPCFLVSAIGERPLP